MDGERDLTLRQRRVLAVVVQHRERHGRPPTCREIAVACGLASTSSVAHHITALAALGYLIRERRIARGL